MAKPARRRRARQATKPRPGAPYSGADSPVSQGPALLKRGEREPIDDPLDGFADDESAQDRWLLDRPGEDMQRENH